MNRLMILGFTATIMLTGTAAIAETRIDAVPHIGASTEGFLRYHQDLRWRRSGLQNYNEGDYERALVDFQRAARFGDKPSQAMLAEMYWQGLGGPADRTRLCLDGPRRRAQLPPIGSAA
ncbi:MAG: hypothetical protein IPK97_12690 [Ahniella sp.]|nr:hypothetical protein [Ahniella sp.]